ncbi:hypothetical protein [Micromonospora tarensis]|uniref:Uncharacterized protein n=1 Tax=Micromonospora tarensis TaxID=2806100 RepID=A0ABS1YRE6_9ACTN|nr:hypothetical protein [Micromonospora tarensis]MBM0280007.1 hypothetical protein [Micromonospora tarensis]
MSVGDSAPSGPESGPRGRACGNRKCGKPLVYSGFGRPKEFCSPDDTRWQPGNRTCKELAAEQRAAELATGLDAPLTAWRAVAGDLVPAMTALSALLEPVLPAVRDVETGALARIAEAETAMADAVQRAQGAEAERDQALNTAHTAERDRAQAHTERRAAEQATQVARADAIRHESTAAAATDRAQAAEARAEHLQTQLDQARTDRTGGKR